MIYLTLPLFYFLIFQVRGQLSCFKYLILQSAARVVVIASNGECRCSVNCFGIYDVIFRKQLVSSV